MAETEKAPELESDTSVQFSSVSQSCPTLCDPMNCSTPGLPVHHQHPEFTQTHVHRVGDAIQPSHPLSSPSPLAPSPSQHQSLFPHLNISGYWKRRLFSHWAYFMVISKKSITVHRCFLNIRLMLEIKIVNLASTSYVNNYLRNMWLAKIPLISLLKR